MRQVLEQEESFDSAVERLRTTPLSSPIYYIVSGISNGTVIERNIQGVHQQYYLNQKNWFLVQTNYDRDQPDPKNDYRREPVEERINGIGQQKFSDVTMYESVISIYPTLVNSTIYSIVMNPSSGLFNMTVWW